MATYKFEFDETEIEFLLGALNNTKIQGVETSRRLVGLVDKITNAVKAQVTNGQKAPAAPGPEPAS